jgi:hypothetical protein
MMLDAAGVQQKAGLRRAHGSAHWRIVFSAMPVTSAVRRGVY